MSLTNSRIGDGGPVIGGATPTLTYEEVFSIDFAAAASVSAPISDGGSLTIDGTAFKTDNAQGGAGVGTIANVNGSGLTITPPTSSAVSITATTRTLPSFIFWPEDVGMTITEGSEFWIILRFPSLVLATASSYALFGWESKSANGGSGSTSGRLEAFGMSLTGANLCPAEMFHDHSGLSISTPPTTTGWATNDWRTMAIKFSGTNIASFFFSTDEDLIDTTTPDTDFTQYSCGTARWRGSPPTDPRFFIMLQHPSSATPTPFIVERMRIIQLVAA